MSGTYSAEIPTYNELLWPTLVAIRKLGHSAKLNEINERVVESEGFTGLLITTGNFTAEAKKEATRDGAPPIDSLQRLRDWGVYSPQKFGEAG